MQKGDTPDFLRICMQHFTMLGCLDENQLALVEEHTLFRQYKKGEVIVHLEDEITHILCLGEGLIKLFVPVRNRQEQIISILTPNDFSGLVGSFSHRRYPFSVAALEDSILCLVPLKIIQDLVKNNGYFALKLLENLGKVEQKILSYRMAIGRLQIRGKIARMLLFFANEIFHSVTYELPVSRKELGEIIDIRTENVVRILSEFRRDGIIQIQGKKIVIINEEFLKKLSQAG